MYQPPVSAAPVDPIIARLRPRTVAEVLDQAFRLYRKYFLTFVAIIAVVHVPLQLVQQLANAVTTGSMLNSLETGLYDPDSTNELLTYYAVGGSVGVRLVVTGVSQLTQRGSGEVQYDWVHAASRDWIAVGRRTSSTSAR